MSIKRRAPALGATARQKRGTPLGASVICYHICGSVADPRDFTILRRGVAEGKQVYAGGVGRDAYDVPNAASLPSVAAVAFKSLLHSAYPPLCATEGLME